MNKISLNAITSWKVLVPAAIIAAVTMVAATFVAKSNTDYICTHIIDDESACAIDEWSPWADVGNGDPEAGAAAGTTYEVTQNRIGTGTKTLSKVIKYLNLRSSCTAGFSQAGHGHRGGASGYIAGTGRTFTTSAVCQIKESRTVTRTVKDPNDPECPYDGAPGCPNDIVKGEVTTTETTGAVTTGGETRLDGLGAINAFRRSMIEAKITLVPALVGHYGDTTEVRWSSREMTSCKVEGDNGDQWLSRTAGKETTSAINGRTVYTLTCTTFEGNTVTKQAVVNRVPVVNEE